MVSILRGRRNTLPTVKVRSREEDIETGKDQNVFIRYKLKYI